jgi:hypothetical protein
VRLTYGQGESQEVKYENARKDDDEGTGSKVVADCKKQQAADAATFAKDYKRPWQSWPVAAPLTDRFEPFPHDHAVLNGPAWTRTRDLPIMSRLL